MALSARTLPTTVRLACRHSSSGSVAAYRELLKAQRALFAGDPSARTLARAETRSHFEANAAAEPEEAAKFTADALDTAGFLRQNVVQAKLNERGNYGARHSPATICAARNGH